jgi:hypothetical protein
MTLAVSVPWLARAGGRQHHEFAVAARTPMLGSPTADRPTACHDGPPLPSTLTTTAPTST